ncbi:MAG: TlpA disulfide reductase family protein [Nocardioides sp.]
MILAARRARAALLLALGILLGACAPAAKEPNFTMPSVGPAHIDVDTPVLRAAKAAAGIHDCPQISGPAVAGGLPEVTLRCLGGGHDVNLAALRGPLVINYWGAWCEPCRRELPILQAYADAAAGRVALIGVDFQDMIPAEAIDLLAAKGVTYPSLADPGGDSDGKPPLRIRTVPMLVFVDAEGRVVHQEFAEMKSVKQLEGLVAEHLGVRP